MNHEQNPVGQRLKLEMKKRGITAVELAPKADVKTSFLYDVISGKSANPSSIKLARVAEALGVNLAYLAGTSDSPTDTGYQFALQEGSPDHVAIARISVNIEAGSPCVVCKTYPDEVLRFKKDWVVRNFKALPEQLRLFSVQGDGMSPTLNAGDTILANCNQRFPSPPGLFLLFDGLALVVKRLEALPHSDIKRVKVISDNPRYAAYETSIDESSIVGRVVWCARCV